MDMFKKLHLKMRLEWLYSAYSLDTIGSRFSRPPAVQRAVVGAQLLTCYATLPSRGTKREDWGVSCIVDAAQFRVYDKPSGLTEDMVTAGTANNLFFLQNNTRLQTEMRAYLGIDPRAVQPLTLKTWWEHGGTTKFYSRVKLPTAQPADHSKYIRACMQSGHGARYDWVRVLCDDNKAYACRVEAIFSLDLTKVKVNTQHTAAAEYFAKTFLLVTRHVCALDYRHVCAHSGHGRDLTCVHPRALLPLVKQDDLLYGGPRAIVELERVQGGLWVVKDPDDKHLKWVMTCNPQRSPPTCSCRSCTPTQAKALRVA